MFVGECPDARAMDFLILEKIAGEIFLDGFSEARRVAGFAGDQATSARRQYLRGKTRTSGGNHRKSEAIGQKQGAALKNIPVRQHHYIRRLHEAFDLLIRDVAQIGQDAFFCRP